jgi:hypothetical protein
MASDTNLNIVLSQGHAVKNIYNVKKQSLELQQQFAAQHTEVKEKRKKEKVTTFSADNKVRVMEDNAGERHGRSDKSQKEPGTEDNKEPGLETEGTLIDIKV